MNKLLDLNGKHILITGSSSGIGKNTAILSNKLGAKVSLVSRNETKLKNVIEELEGNENEYFPFDLQNICEISDLINDIVSKNGKLDGYVHSAGIGDIRPLKFLKYNHMEKVMKVNFYSFIEIIKSITKNNYNDKLSIVGISSTSSQQGDKGKTIYSASKGAMDSSIRCLAKELSNKNIRINSVAPGFIKTNRYKEFLDRTEGSDEAERIKNRQYLGLGETEDVANMLVYLLSDASKFITGASFPVDGGRLSS